MSTLIGGRLGSFPTYISARVYPLTPPATIASGTAIGTLDTVIYLTPLAFNYDFTFTAVSVRVVTGAGSSAVKMAVWAGSPRPTGTPLWGSNTGQATTGNNSNASISISGTLKLGTQYWFGSAFTTAAPTMLGPTTSVNAIEALLGKSAMASSVIASMTAPFTYSNDITALDLTAATFTDSGAAGIPTPYFTAA